MSATMRMAELSSTSGVSVASIKLYLREGILPAGQHTSPNQALYGEAHLRRLTLIRALRDVAGLSLASIRSVVDVIDQPNAELLDALAAMADTLVTPPEGGTSGPFVDEAAKLLDKAIAARGWEGASADNPSRALVVEALAGILAVGADVTYSVRLLEAYAHAAEIVATADIVGLHEISGTDRIVELAAVWTVMGNSILAGLRGMAHEVVSRQELADPHPDPDPDPDTGEADDSTP